MSERAIVLVTSSFPIRGDGSEAAGSFVADLAEAIAKHAPVRVVAPGAEPLREAWSERVEVIRYAAPSQPLSTLKPWRPAELQWIVRVLRGGLAATRAAAATDAAQVFALWGLPCGEWARRVARERGIPYSVWMLGSDVWSLGKLPILRGMLARVMREAAAAYADGYQLADDAFAIGAVPVEFLPSTRAIAAHVPPARATPPYRLLYLGRWHPNKGVDLLLDALALLSEPDWARIERIEIQGGGPLDALVREKVAALKARGRPVEIGRFLAKSEAEAAIGRADWLLIPSRIESIPVVFSDAMKLGRPIVSTRVGDLGRLLDASDIGVASAEVSATAFADALHHALLSSASERSAALAAAARPFSLEQSIVPRILAGTHRGTGTSARR